MNKQDWMALCDITNYFNEISEFVISKPIDTQQGYDLAAGALVLKHLVTIAMAEVSDSIVRGN